MGIIPVNLNSEPREKDHARLAQPFGEYWNAWQEYSAETWELPGHYPWLRSYSFWRLSQNFNKEGWKSANTEVNPGILKNSRFHKFDQTILIA